MEQDQSVEQDQLVTKPRQREVEATRRNVRNCTKCTQREVAHGYQMVILMAGLPKIRHGRSVTGVAGVARHAVGGVKDAVAGLGRVIGAETADRKHVSWECIGALALRRDDKGVGESQAAAMCGRLDGKVDILAPSEAVREQNETFVVREGGGVVPRGGELFGNGRVGNNDAGNRGSIVRSNEEGRGASGNSTIIQGDAKETSANREMEVLTGIVEADVAFRQRTVTKEEGGIVGGACHGAVVGMSEGGRGDMIVGSREAAKKEGVDGKH